MPNVKEMIAKALDRGQRSLSEFESKQILAHYGIPVVKEVLVKDLDGARQAAGEIGYPVVLKVCSAEITHKTEKGLIELDLRDEKDLGRAFERLQKAAGGWSGDFLVQQMARGPRELVAGMTRDAQFGPCVMLGLGGIFTETLNDVSFRVAPIGEHDVLDMVEELRGEKMLGPVRGMDAVSMETLTRTLMALGSIGLEHPHIHEIDVNPLVVQGNQPVAVDALVVLGEPAEELPETRFEPHQLDLFLAPKHRHHRGLLRFRQTGKRRDTKYHGQRVSRETLPGEPQGRGNSRDKGPSFH